MNDHGPNQTPGTTETEAGRLPEWAVTCLDRLFSAMANPSRL